MSDQSNVGRWTISGTHADGSTYMLGDDPSQWVNGGTGDQPEWEWVTEGLEPFGVLEHGDSFIAERFVNVSGPAYIGVPPAGSYPLYRREVVTRKFTVCQHCEDGRTQLTQPGIDPDPHYFDCGECGGDYRRWETT